MQMVSYGWDSHHGKHQTTLKQPLYFRDNQPLDGGTCDLLASNLQSLLSRCLLCEEVLGKSNKQLKRGCKGRGQKIWYIYIYIVGVQQKLFLSIYFTIQLNFLLSINLTALFGTIYKSHCTISANFYLYLQYFQQKVFSFNKINRSQMDPQYQSDALAQMFPKPLRIMRSQIQNFHIVFWDHLYEILISCFMSVEWRTIYTYLGKQ